jgi:hypothetical protein
MVIRDATTGKRLAQHPLLQRRNNERDGDESSLAFIGFPDNGDDGKQRLYLNPKLDCYIEFSEKDILKSESILVGVFPFTKHEVTQVFLDPHSDVKGTLVLNSRNPLMSRLGGFGWPKGSSMACLLDYHPCKRPSPQCP